MPPPLPAPPTPGRGLARGLTPATAHEQHQCGICHQHFETRKKLSNHLGKHMIEHLDQAGPLAPQPLTHGRRRESTASTAPFERDYRPLNESRETKKRRLGGAGGVDTPARKRKRDGKKRTSTGRDPATQPASTRPTVPTAPSRSRAHSTPAQRQPAIRTPTRPSTPSFGRLPGSEKLKKWLVPLARGELGKTRTSSDFTEVVDLRSPSLSPSPSPSLSPSSQSSPPPILIGTSKSTKQYTKQNNPIKPSKQRKPAKQVKRLRPSQPIVKGKEKVQRPAIGKQTYVRIDDSSDNESEDETQSESERDSASESDEGCDIEMHSDDDVQIVPVSRKDDEFNRSLPSPSTSTSSDRSAPRWATHNAVSTPTPTPGPVPKPALALGPAQTKGDGGDHISVSSSSTEETFVVSDDEDGEGSGNESGESGESVDGNGEGDRDGDVGSEEEDELVDSAVEERDMPTVIKDKIVPNITTTRLIASTTPTTPTAPTALTTAKATAAPMVFASTSASTSKPAMNRSKEVDVCLPQKRTSPGSALTPTTSDALEAITSNAPNTPAPNPSTKSTTTPTPTLTQTTTTSKPTPTDTPAVPLKATPPFLRLSEARQAGIPLKDQFTRFEAFARSPQSFWKPSNGSETDAHPIVTSNVNSKFYDHSGTRLGEEKTSPEISLNKGIVDLEAPKTPTRTSSGGHASSSPSSPSSSSASSSSSSSSSDSSTPNPNAPLSTSFNLSTLSKTLDPPSSPSPGRRTNPPFSKSPASRGQGWTGIDLGLGLGELGEMGKCGDHTHGLGHKGLDETKAGEKEREKGKEKVMGEIGVGEVGMVCPALVRALHHLLHAGVDLSCPAAGVKMEAEEGKGL